MHAPVGPSGKVVWGVGYGVARGPPEVLGMRLGDRGEGLSDAREISKKAILGRKEVTRKNKSDFKDLL